MSYDLKTPDAELRFTAYLPTHALPFGHDIVTACKAKDVDPFLIFALGDHESIWGQALKQMAGDWGARRWTEADIATFPHVRRLQDKPGTDGRWAVVPEDGLGWGRGYMQLDFVDQYSWLSTHDWKDATLNIERGIDVFLSKQAFFASKIPAPNITDGSMVVVNDWFAGSFKVGKGQYPDPRPLIGGVLEVASVAAYNAAKENVLRMIVAGGIARIDEVTTGGNYSSDVLSRAAAQHAHFMQDA